MTDNPPTKGGTLVRIKMVTREFATGHTTDGVDEVAAVEIFKPVLIRVMGVGTTVEVVRRRVFPSFLVTGVLQTKSVHGNDELEGLTR